MTKSLSQASLRQSELWNRKARHGKARRSQPKLQKFDAVEIMDGWGEMYENDAKL